jgi:hypothetical protein
MKIVALFFVVLMSCLFTRGPVQAADSCTECREYYRACAKNHSQTACKTDLDICMKHCRKK